MRARKILRRRATGRTLLSITIALSPLAESTSALMASHTERPTFPNLEAACTVGVRSLGWYLQGSWTSGEATQATAGVESWNSYRNVAGERIFSSTNTMAGISVVRVADTGDNNTYCTSGGIPTSIHIGAASGGNFFKHVTFHEPGHAHGLSHAGNDDDLLAGTVTGEPLMRGCGSSVLTQSADDWAQSSYRWDAGRVTPNGGFENSGFWYGSWNPLTGGYGGTPRYAEVAAGSNVRRPTRITTSPSVIRMRANYKHNSASPGRLKFQFRAISYSSGLTCPDGGGPFNPSTFNWNSPSTPGVWIQLENRSLPASSGWTTSSGTVPPPNPGFGFAAYMAVDVEVSLWAPGDQAIFADNVEVYI